MTNSTDMTNNPTVRPGEALPRLDALLLVLAFLAIAIGIGIGVGFTGARWVDPSVAGTGGGADAGPDDAGGGGLP